MPETRSRYRVMRVRRRKSTRKLHLTRNLRHDGIPPTYSLWTGLPFCSDGVWLSNKGADDKAGRGSVAGNHTATLGHAQLIDWWSEEEYEMWFEGPHLEPGDCVSAKLLFVTEGV